MTSTDEHYGHGRFGAAAPGARPDRPSLEEVLTAPEKPVRRRRWMIVLSVVLVAVLAGGGGYLAGRLTAPAQPKLTKLLVTATALPAGARLTSADLRLVTVQPGVNPPPGSLGPASERDLVGLSPRMAVPPGTFVTRSLLAAAGAVPSRSQALVGLSLRPGQLPAAGLAAGERVLVVIVPPSANVAAWTLADTTVWDVQGSAASGATVATVIVPATIAARLAGEAARGEVALVATASAKVAAPVSASSAARGSPGPKPSTKPKH